MIKLVRENKFLQTVLIVGGIWILWKLKPVVLVLFIAFLLSTIWHPVIRFLKNHRWPTALAILVPLVCTIGLVGLIFYFLLPPFLERITNFVQDLPHILDSASKQLKLNVRVSGASSLAKGHFGSISHAVLTISQKVLKLLAGALTILVLTIYWLSSYDTVKRELLALLPVSRRNRVEDIWSRIEVKLRYWIKAHLVLNTVVGLMVWVALTLLGVPFADLMAFIAFLVEIIPTAGPFIAAAPAIGLGLSQSLLKGLLVALTYIVIQQIESHALSPMLLGKTVRLHPIVIIISLLLGVEAYGILGALVAVPIALCVSSVVDSFRGQPQEVEPGIIHRMKRWNDNRTQE